MPHYKFPNTVYDQPQNLLATLGSWWADDYSGKDQVRSLVMGKAQVEQQSMLDLMELIASMSRFSVPIYHTDNWYALYLKKSEMNSVQTSLLRYDGGATFDGGERYDVPLSTPNFAFPRPADLVEAPLIMNRFTDPTMTLTQEIDYVFVDDSIILRQNPFDDIRVAKRPVYDDGNIVDEEALVWVFRGQFDWDTTYRQFGYVIGMRLQSSKGYRDLLNAVYDSMVGGTTAVSILSALSAMTGVPLVREAEETITDIDTDPDNLLIITDQHVYKYDLAAVPTVAIGDVVKRGGELTDVLQISELNRGAIPSSVAALALGEGFLSSCFYADLVFEDRDTALTVDETDPSGYTKLSWTLGGFPNDVDAFFDDMHTRGVAEAEREIDPCEEIKTIRYPANDCDEVEVVVRLGTLAHLMDQRPVQVGEPKKSHLPATINPLKFLVTNVLRNNAYIVRVRAAAAGADGVGLHNVRLLRKVLPPHTAMILVVELTAATDSVTVDLINEQVSTFVGMTPLADPIVDMVKDSRVRVRVINGTCQ